MELIYLLPILLALLILLPPLYNLLLHPLRSFPGPLLHRISPIPYALLLPTGRAPQEIHRLHELYGPVVRIAPNHLSFTDPRAWRDVYGLHSPHLPASTSLSFHGSGTATTSIGEKEKGASGERIENPKAPIWYRSLLSDADGHDFLNAPAEKHTKMRKALAVGFADRALKAQEGRIQYWVDVFIRRLGEKVSVGGGVDGGGGEGEGVVVDMVRWMNWVVLDIMGELVFAEPFGCLEGEREPFFVEMFGEMLRPGVVLVGMQYVGFKWLVPWVLRWVGGRRALVAMKGELERRLRGRIAKGEVVDDVLEGVLGRRDEWGMSMPELAGTAHIVITAASETTPTALSGAVNLLLRNPDKMEKLKHEIRSTFSSAEEITMLAVSKLPYLLACIQESLRMFPPATHGMVREAAGGGAIVAGHYVPEKTLIECQIYSMNHSSAHWSEPFSFKPERFLHRLGEGEKPADGKGDNFDAFRPFQHGTRDCIGRNLAHAEMRLILARLLFHFDIAPQEVGGEDWAEKQKAYFLRAKTPLNVMVRPAVRSG
ncbi:Isotrichodermin C-15 hydroxylase [Podospora aff. communis PSN243]|uniref:Isotrichodermin C-15 hydroxylase n=1 Tax=Podospora aff. communis PSN243 TaxID=3040156 RepID=A0AAV9G349_9PEZI|nr:Isotrichodermin C-15 hydroxylase [Podospora aff. communis PSN243]